MTLLYLGNPAADGSGPWDVTHVAAVTKIFTKRAYQVEGYVSGVGRFVGPEDEDVLVALVDSPELPQMRSCLMEDLSWECAIPHNAPLYRPEHGFTPHITLAYVPKATDTPRATLDEPMEIKFDSLSVVAGGDRVDFHIVPLVEDATAEFSAYYDSQKTRGSEKPVVASPAPEDEPELERASQAGALDAPESPEAVYHVTKAADERRFTLGPLYAPMRKDAHGEFITEDDLQEAVWDYVRTSAAEGRRIHLQHGEFGSVTVGEWVECMAWPYDHTIIVKDAAGNETEQEMPAGTVYFGVVWDEKAWPLVKSGKLGGYSLGGRAIKIETEANLPDMGFKKA